MREHVASTRWEKKTLSLTLKRLEFYQARVENLFVFSANWGGLLTE